MWKAITSDLQEFVSTVADEQHNSSIHSDDDGDSTDENGVKKETELAVGEEGESLETGFDATGLVADAADEVARLQTLEETYTEPLLLLLLNEDQEDRGAEEEDFQDQEEKEEVIQFLNEFDIESKTEEIAQLLQDHPNTIKLYFEDLVPTSITYKEFWERYFFRCDETRILRQWEQEEEVTRQARSEALQAGLSTVTNLLGGAKQIGFGAIQAVSKTLSQADQAAAAAEDNRTPTTTSRFHFQAASDQMSSKTSSSLSLFGNSGRPPFVMNTAVDDDDEKEEEEEEEAVVAEEDWEDDEEVNISETTIMFTGGGQTALEEQLNQAISERDLLKGTVDLQAQEIRALREGKQTKSQREEMESLKVALFEKDAEIAALKESLKDTHEDGNDERSMKDSAMIASLERELEKLRTELSAKDETMKKMRAEFEAKLATEAANARQEAIRQMKDQQKAKAVSEIEKVQLESEKAAKERESEFEFRLSDAVAQAKDEARKQQEMEFEAKLADAPKHAEHPKSPREVSPSSASTGVKIDSILAPADGGDDHSNNDDDDDDGWGSDGWGDDV